jgi:predicted nucleic acid-binding protein
MMPKIEPRDTSPFRPAEGSPSSFSFIAAARVPGVEEETSRHYAGIRAALKKAGSPIPSNDLWVAALYRQHRLPLLSQYQHFDAVEGLERVGW